MATHYRPALWAKRGERTAVSEFSEDEHQSFTPIFLVPPRDWDHANDRAKKTYEDHLDGLPAQLASVRSRVPAYIDLTHVADEAEPVHGQHALTWLVEEAARNGMELWPVLSLSSPDATHEAARDLNQKEKTRIAFRLTPDEWPTAVRSKLDDLLSYLGVDSQDVDLILDLQHDVSSPLARRLVAQEIGAMGDGVAWKSVTVGGAGMPQNPSTGKGVIEIDRADWHLFAQIETGALDAQVDFLDYGINRASIATDIDHRFTSSLAKFTYATPTEWLHSRGELFRGGARAIGGEAVPPMLRNLTGFPGYGQTPKNKADEWIESVLAGGSGGNAETWVRWGTYHHIKTVLHQLAN